MKKDLLFLILIVSALATVFLIRGIGGTAPTPGVFSEGYDLPRALALSAETGKPVVAVATADWCPPCQALKRDALSEPGVVAYMREHTIPVYIEESTGMEQIRELGVRAYPTTVVLTPEGVVGTIEGNEPPARFLAIIRDAVESSG